jgi:hypothetical protein
LYEFYLPKRSKSSQVSEELTSRGKVPASEGL